MNKPLLTIVVLVPLLSGCATALPQRTPGDVVPLSEEWSIAAPQGSAPASWGAVFGDPRLDALISEGLEANRNLEAAAARVERAGAQAKIAGADLLPQATAGADGARRKQNFIGLPIPGAEDRILTNLSTTLGTSLNVSWELDVWGRLRHARHASHADLDAAAADYEAARLSLAGQIAKSWFAALEANEQLALAQATRDNRARNVERVRRRYESGLASSVDLRLAESTASVAAARLEARRRQLDATRRQLEVLLGRYPSSELETAGSLPTTRVAVPAGIPAEVIAQRPDIRSAERRAAAAAARLGQAKASLYPQIRLTGSAGTATNDLATLLDGDFSVWSFVSNLVQPVFQGGRLRAGVDLAEAVEDEALALFAQNVLNACAEVETALYAQDVLARQEEALVDAARHAAAARRTAERRYASGIADYLLVLESQRQAFDAESQLLDARRQRLVSRVDLLLALGGGVEPISQPALASTEANGNESSGQNARMKEME